MQIGCGTYVHTVRGRPYLYFWHYETRGARRVQVKEYVGPARSPGSWADAAGRCDAYFAGLRRELERMRRATLASLRPRKA